jgi:hypothetical protein
VHGGHQVGRGGVVDPVAGRHDRMPEPDRQMGLADPGWAHEQRMGAGVQERQGGQLGNQGPVDRGLEVEVEVGQVLFDREVGKAQPRPVAALAGGGDLLAKQRFQERHVRQLLGAGGLQVGSQQLLGAGELEVGQVAAQGLVAGGRVAAGHGCCQSWS